MLNRFEQRPYPTNEPILTRIGTESFPFNGMELPKLSFQELTVAYSSSIPKSIVHSETLIQNGITRPMSLSLDLVLANHAILDRALQLTRANNLGRDIRFENGKIIETSLNSSVIETPLNEILPTDFSSTKSIKHGSVITKLPLLLQLRLEPPRNPTEKSIQDELSINILFGGSSYSMVKRKSTYEEGGTDASSRQISEYWLNSAVDPKSKKIVFLPYHNAIQYLIAINPELDSSKHPNI